MLGHRKLVPLVQIFIALLTVWPRDQAVPPKVKWAEMKPLDPNTLHFESILTLRKFLSSSFFHLHVPASRAEGHGILQVVARGNEINPS